MRGGEICGAPKSRMSTQFFRSLHGGDILGALNILAAQGASALSGASVLEDVLPVALQALAESYDRNGIVGDEERFFLLARECWRFMTPAERSIGEMVCTFVTAGLKFDQPAFLCWAIPIAASHPGLSIRALASDRSYALNQLRHSAVFYAARTGSVEAYELLRDACGGACPLVLEADSYGPHAAAVEAAAAADGGDARRRDTMMATGKGAAFQVPDPPALYAALAARRGAFIAHVLRRAEGPATQARLLRLAVVYGVLPADDTEGAARLLEACADAGVGRGVVMYALGAGRGGGGGGDGGGDGAPLPPLPFNCAPAPAPEDLDPARPPPLFALHLACFVVEGSADSRALRSHASARYASWLLRGAAGGGGGAYVGVVPRAALLAPLPVMRWAGCGAPGAPARWEGWTALHSACASGEGGVVNSVMGSSVGEGALALAAPEPPAPYFPLTPLRVAADAAFWTRRFSAIRFLASCLPPREVEAQLYSPLRAERREGALATRTAFLKTLCKEANLSLRAMRPGNEGGVGGSGGGGGGSDAPSRAPVAPAQVSMASAPAHAAPPAPLPASTPAPAPTPTPAPAPSGRRRQRTSPTAPGEWRTWVPSPLVGSRDSARERAGGSGVGLGVVVVGGGGGGGSPPAPAPRSRSESSAHSQHSRRSLSAVAPPLLSPPRSEQQPAPADQAVAAVAALRAVAVMALAVLPADARAPTPLTPSLVEDLAACETLLARVTARLRSWAPRT